ncbi:unnamed protein product [Plutella xylostella]|uniref:(diamondback moth) hypothetical protein n=1 Tax=Plutella xylostella TaxID=51655 RepID=A0A8S4FWR4_PLUXY|nr:unnamed protein product [Plutella xylostella]
MYSLFQGNFNPRQSFPPPQQMQQEPPQIAPEMPQRLQMPPRSQLPPRPQMPQERPNLPHPQYRPERPMFPPNQRFNQPNFGPNIRPMPYQPFRPQFNRPFGPNMREIGPNNHHMPQVTIRQPLPPNPMGPKMDEFPGKMLPLPGREPEVRMLPVQLPNNLPPGGLAGKKVLINPHFKGNFQPPIEGLTYIPTRIPKSPPIDPTLENKFGPVKDIDDAAERFIAEQRNALARAAARAQRKSPQRFIENTTIEIANELASTRDDDLLRRQEAFINANRAGLRRRMRTPSPPRRSPSPPRRRSPPPRHNNPPDEESEYRRRVREQESLRERVLRAKEVRRRKNAVTLQKQLQERQRLEKEPTKPDSEPPKPIDAALDKDRKPEPLRTDKDRKPEVIRTVPKSPERVKSPPRPAYEDLTPPREASPVKEPPSQKSPERNMTPPLPPPSARAVDRAADIDLEIDDLDLILGDIDGILSDDEDVGRSKGASKQADPPKPKTDLRSRLPPRPAQDARPPKQRIVFNEDRDEKTRRDKSPPAKKVAVEKTSPPAENNENVEKKQAKAKQDTDTLSWKMRQRITYENKQREPEKEEKPDDAKKPQPFLNRRVVLQRKAPTPTKLDKPDKSVFSRIEIKTDPTKPNPGIFSRAVRTAIGTDKSRIVLKKQEEPQVEYESESDVDEEKLLSEEVGMVAVVVNLPHGMTDTRLKTLAGSDVQNLSLDKEERSARITFKTTVAAESFRKKFNNKMVAASRLTVTLK